MLIILRTIWQDCTLSWFISVASLCLWMGMLGSIWSVTHYKCGMCVCVDLPASFTVHLLRDSCVNRRLLLLRFSLKSCLTCLTIRGSWGGERDRDHGVILHAAGCQHMVNPSGSLEPITNPVNHCLLFHKKEMCSCLLLPRTLEFFSPFPSAFCVKKFCLNNYLSVPFAHSQHHHSSTFCFQLVLISNGLLVSICSQRHQSAQNYPETWRNVDKAETYQTVQWESPPLTLAPSFSQETWDRRWCPDMLLI